MPEKMNVKFSLPRREPAPPIRRRATLSGVIKWIEAKGLDPETERKMIARVKRWPNNALDKFVETFSEQMIKLRKRENKKIRNSYSSKPKENCDDFRNSQASSDGVEDKGFDERFREEE
jgi:hypothetical protein